MTLRTFQVGLIVAICAVGGMGLKSAFVSWEFAPLVVLAALGAAAVSVAAKRWEVPFPLSVALSLVALVVVGTVLTYGFPWMLPQFVGDLVLSWRRILTIAAPVDPQSALVAVPIASTWLGVMVGSELALRTDRIALPVLGPVLTIAAAILFGLNQTGLSLWVGLTTFVLSVVLVALRSTTHWLWTTQKGVSSRRPRLLMSGLVVGATVLLAPLVASQFFGIDPVDRFTFRQQVDPPFDLTRLSSPLAELKGSLPTAEMTEQGDKGKLALRVSGDPISRIRLAVLDDYDGTVWLINRNADGADFIRAGTQFPPPDRINQGDSVSNAFEIVSLRESWLPTAGTAVGLEITSDVRIGGVVPVELIRLDRVTGNLIIRPRITTVEGLRYNVESVPPVEGDSIADRLVDASVLTSARNVRIGDVPAQISSLSREVTSGFDSPFEKVVAIASRLEEQVYDAEARPGHLMIQLATLAERDPMVGFDEQYAALMATMLRAEGIPARVVVGFVPPDRALGELGSGGSVDVYETDIEAWVEVPFEGHGWVAFDAGPPDTQTDDVDEGVSEAQAETVSANPPPPTTSTTTTTIPEAEEDEEDSEDETDEEGGLPTALIAGAVAVAVPLGLFGLFAGTVVLLKARRRLRRRTVGSASERIHGAFREYVDHSLDAGYEVDGPATARSTVAALADEEFDPTLRSGSLVVLVEDAAFSPAEPSDDEVELAWQHSDALAGRIGADHSAIERLRSRLSMRSLWRSRKGR